MSRQTISEKIISAHLLSGAMKPGEEIVIRVDQTLTQDATGTMAYLQFEALGAEKIATGLSVSYVDHNTLQDGFENMDDHRYLQSVAARFGILYSRAGNGICHQVHLERFARPGKTLLGSDSHTPTAGGMGMIAMGAGGLDVAMAMATGEFTFTMPHVINMELKGRPGPWVTAKDVILEVLRMLGTKGNVGNVVEYTGPGTALLSVPERATITNMGAELGVTCSVFPSDENTRAFLAAQDREDQFVEIQPDDGAAYARHLVIDLAVLEPLAATPHSPGNISTIRALAGMPVQQVCIGSCTNSSYTDLVTVAEILKGRKVAPETSLIVAPGSRQVLAAISQNGALADMVKAGARIMESACGFCIGMGQAPGTNAVSLRTNNRNFLGRSGTRSAQVYLVSPQSAAAAALSGKITDPRSLGSEPSVVMPERFDIDDGMICPPARHGEKVEIIRGPNIGEPPSSEPLKNSLDGIATIKVGDRVTTDHIMPAGRRMKYRSNIPRYSEFVFENVDREFSSRAAANRDMGIDNFIIAGQSYGQGSSREHAAICPMYLGVRMVCAKSIERIHRSNLINFGIVPAVFVNAADYERMNPGDRLNVIGLRKAIENGDSIILHDGTSGTDIELKCSLGASERETLLAGGALNRVRDKLKS